ncbi:MAG: hypothetical protein AAGJ87_08745, partial [Pseudomonadota bacterium]
MRAILLPVIGLAAMVGVAHAGPIAIADFEGPAAGTPVGDPAGADVDFGFGVTAAVTTSSNIGQSIIFDTTDPTSADSDLEAPFTRVGAENGILDADGPGGPTPGNVLIISENGAPFTPADDDASGGSITFVFSEIVTFLGFDALDVGDTAQDTFTYTIDDGNGGTDTATVTID